MSLSTAAALPVLFYTPFYFIFCNTFIHIHLLQKSSLDDIMVTPFEEACIKESYHCAWDFAI